MSINHVAHTCTFVRPNGGVFHHTVTFLKQPMLLEKARKTHMFWWIISKYLRNRPTLFSFPADVKAIFRLISRNSNRSSISLFIDHVHLCKWREICHIVGTRTLSLFAVLHSKGLIPSMWIGHGELVWKWQMRGSRMHPQMSSEL